MITIKREIKLKSIVLPELVKQYPLVSPTSESLLLIPSLFHLVSHIPAEQSGVVVVTVELQSA